MASVRLRLAVALAFASSPALAADRLPPPPPPASQVGSATTTSAAAPRESVATTSSSSSVGDKSIYVAPLLGYSTNDMNLGLGVRGAKMITDRFSVGGTFVYQLGRSTGGTTTVAAPGYPVAASYSASFSMFYLGPEAAYDFPVAPVIVRPYAGIGLASLSTSVSGGGVSAGTSDTKLVLWPGCQVIYDVVDTAYFVGGDVRLVTVPGGPALGMFVTGGMKI